MMKPACDLRIFRFGAFDEPGANLIRTHVSVGLWRPGRGDGDARHCRNANESAKHRDCLIIPTCHTSLARLILHQTFCARVGTSTVTGPSWTSMIFVTLPLSGPLVRIKA